MSLPSSAAVADKPVFRFELSDPAHLGRRPHLLRKPWLVVAFVVQTSLLFGGMGPFLWSVSLPLVISLIVLVCLMVGLAYLVLWLGPGLAIKTEFSKSLPEDKQCKSCGCFAPPRSHHCWICQACVHDYDHHCFVLEACIGRRNFRPFVLLILVAQAFCCSAFYACVLVLVEFPGDYLYAYVCAWLSIFPLLVEGIFMLTMLLHLLVVISHNDTLENCIDADKDERLAAYDKGFCKNWWWFFTSPCVPFSKTDLDLMNDEEPREVVVKRPRERRSEVEGEWEGVVEVEVEVQ